MPAALKRDLGSLESYATLVGILVGAGIFRVTSDAFALTGPSILAGHVVLAVAILATSVPYVVFLSTPLGRETGGECLHIARTFGGERLVPLVTFVGAWLKLISYLGAGAVLAVVLADYLIQLEGMLFGVLDAERDATWLALAAMLALFAVNVVGVRWFGRVQIAMCAVLGVSIVVLVVPGLFFVELDNLRPFATGGPAGFAASLPPLFFAYAGFEALAHTGGEVEASTRRLPRVFLRGIVATTVVFLSMSFVAMGVLPPERLADSAAPMAEVGAMYLPFGASALVTLGGVFAVATSLNVTFYVPSRLALSLCSQGLLPRRLGFVHARWGTPVVLLALTLAATAALVLSGRVELALNIAVFCLVVLYGLHSLALLALPRRNPELYRQVESSLSRPVQVAASLVSLIAMAGLVVVLVAGDVQLARSKPFLERLAAGEWTSIELLALWGALGLIVHALRPR